MLSFQVFMESFQDIMESFQVFMESFQDFMKSFQVCMESFQVSQPRVRIVHVKILCNRILTNFHVIQLLAVAVTNYGLA